MQINFQQLQTILNNFQPTDKMPSNTPLTIDLIKEHNDTVSLLMIAEIFDKLSLIEGVDIPKAYQSSDYQPHLIYAFEDVTEHVTNQPIKISDLINYIMNMELGLTDYQMID